MAEFNTFMDAVAAARVYALTSKRPPTTMPLITPASSIQAAAPKTLENPLKIKLVSLDLTRKHNLKPSEFRTRMGPLVAAGSPLAQWVSVMVEHTFDKLESLHETEAGEEPALSLHDPVCIWYALTSSSPEWTTTKNSPVDLRVETTGQWTRGMCVVDRRTRKRREDDDEENIDDANSWLGRQAGNRIDVLEGAPGDEAELGKLIFDRVFPYVLK